MTFTELLRRKGIDFHRAVSNHDEISLHCVFCADSRYRLCINIRSGAGICFNCGFKSRYAVPMVLRKLNTAVEVDYDNAPAPMEPPATLPGDFLPLLRDTDPAPRRYLKQRGITLDQIRNNRIGTSYVGKYAYRIVFPIWDGKNLQGFTARDFVGNRQPKYLHSPGTKGLFNLRDAYKVIISEGVFKALRIEQVANKKQAALACLGHSLSNFQIEQLRQHKVSSVCIWPDPDIPGCKGAAAMADMLSDHGFKTTMVWPTSYADEEGLDVMATRLLTTRPWSCTLRSTVLLGGVRR